MNNSSISASFKIAFFFIALSFLALRAGAAILSVNSNFIQIAGDTATGLFGIGTSAAYTPSLATLTYSFPNPSNTSHIVASVNGTLTDYSTAVVSTAMVSSGSGLGAYIQVTKTMSSGVLLTAHYEIVNNPQTGVQPDTAMMQFIYQNTGASTATVGLRVMIDTMVNSNDGANISINNGLSTVLTDTLYTQNAGTLFPNWWDYDIPPPGTPNLVGHGSVYNNASGIPATKPDAEEVAYWWDVNGSAQWVPGASGVGITDSAVVLWWTGSADNTTANIPLAAGQSITFTTYYGLNQIGLLTTPTYTSTFTPVITPTWTLTPVFSYTPTDTLSPTLTSTQTPTLTPTLSPTYTPTLTFTLSPTQTNTFTLTPTPTVTLTPTITPTFTVTLTPTNTMTPTISFTPTITSTATCQIEVYPDPFSPTFAVDNQLRFSCLPENAQVFIYTVSGEYVQKASKMEKLFVWDGRNRFGVPTSPGIYFYVIQGGSGQTLQTGKFLKI